MVLRQAVRATIAAAVWLWALGRRLVGLRPRRAARAEKSVTRRRYALGAVSRHAFDAAMRKRKRRPSSR